LSGGQRTHTFIYTAEQMGAWRTWWRDTLLQGRRWFTLNLPGYEGMTPRVVRYLEVSQSLIGAGVYAVEARLELREANKVEPPPPPEAPTSTIAYKTQTAFVTNGSLSTFGEHPWPVTSSVGDLGIVAAFTEPGRTATATTGWDVVDTFACTSGAAGATCTLFGRVKQTGDTGMVVSASGGNSFIGGQFLVYENQRTNYFDAAAGLTDQAAANPLLFANPVVSFKNTQVLLVAIRAGGSWPWFVLATYSPGNLTDSTKTADSGWTAGGRQAAISIVRATLPSDGSVGTISGSTTVSSQYSTRVIALR
jgi:hypothetical protein